MLLNFKRHTISSGSEKGDLWCQCACYEDGFMHLIGVDGKMLYYKLTKEGMSLKGFYPTKCIGCTQFSKWNRHISLFESNAQSIAGADKQRL